MCGLHPNVPHPNVSWSCALVEHVLQPKEKTACRLTMGRN
jgi:hypothetical protein